MVAYLRKLPSPLAIYFFGSNNQTRQFRKSSLYSAYVNICNFDPVLTRIRRRLEVFDNTRSGQFVQGDVVTQFIVPNLPFGGVGPSGTGNYHGSFGFFEFSHLRADLSVPMFIEAAQASKYPPYSRQYLPLNLYPPLEIRADGGPSCSRQAQAAPDGYGFDREEGGQLVLTPGRSGGCRRCRSRRGRVRPAGQADPGLNAPGSGNKTPILKPTHMALVPSCLAASSFPGRRQPGHDCAFPFTSVLFCCLVSFTCLASHWHSPSFKRTADVIGSPQMLAVDVLATKKGGERGDPDQRPAKA